MTHHRMFSSNLETPDGTMTERPALSDHHISEVRDQGYCVLRNHFPPPLIAACRDAFWPRLLAHLRSGERPNRGPYRHYLAMPLEPSGVMPQFFLDPGILAIVRGPMDDRVVADQMGVRCPGARVGASGGAR
jgi:hypothetical protein